MKLGDVVRDKKTGFTGVLTRRLPYVKPCERWQVSKRKNGEIIDVRLFDVDELEVVKKQPD